MSKGASTAVRLAPAAMVAVAAVLGLKAIAIGESVAQTGPAPASQAQTAQTASAQSTAPAPASTPQCPTPTLGEEVGISQSEVQVLQALRDRRSTLDQRAEQFETRDELMLAAERRLDERLAELHRLEANVNELLGHLDEAQEQRMAALVDVYQRMRAKDAATVFDGLDDDVLVQVASRMRQQNLAEVMGRMNPERARLLTQRLAERARPPSVGSNLLTSAPSASGGG